MRPSVLISIFRENNVCHSCKDALNHFDFCSKCNYDKTPDHCYFCHRNVPYVVITESNYNGFCGNDCRNKFRNGSFPTRG